MLELKKIELSDKKWIDPLLKLSDYRGCEYNFTNNYVWSNIYGITVGRFQDFYVSKHGNEFVFPAGKGDTDALLSELKNYCDSTGIHVAGCGIKSEVAITHDYETGWALDGEADITWGIIKNGYESTSKAFFNAFMRKNIPADIIPYSEDFSKYKVICLNVPYLMDEALAEKIKDYVKNGGILISTYFTAVADKSDLCHLGGVPALGLSEVFGLRVDEQDSYESIPGKNSVNYNGKSYPLSLIAEVIRPSGAEALAEYESDYYKGTPAVTKHAYGKGTAYYIGFTPSYEFMEEFIADVAKEHSVLPTEGITAENGVHITLRSGDGEKYYFAVNYTDEEKKCTLSKALYNMADEKTESGEIVIEPRGVKIYSEK